MHTTLPPYFGPRGDATDPGAPPADLQVLGHDRTSWFVVRPDGSVWSVNPRSTFDTRFVNSTAPLFLASLDALAERRPRLGSSDGEIGLDAVQSLRHELNRLDIACLGDQDYWWGALLDRLEDELP
ncbi:MAG: SUKH-4 family immunity protein [Acidimicrobiales bacterium]